MTHFTNARIMREGHAIRINVEVDYDESVSITNGEVQWSGWLQPPNNIGLEVGHAYTLVLPGFKPARILITEEANPVDGTVAFRGVGERPLAVPSEQCHGAR